MTWSFNPAKVGERDKDYVRQLIGDIDKTDQQLQDETIEGILSRAGDDPLQAAIIACYGIMASYARRVSISVDGLKLSLEERYEHYKGVALQLKILGATQGIGAPIVAGVNLDDMASVNANTNRPPSRDLVGMMEMPGVLPPTGSDWVFTYWTGYGP